MRPDGGAEPTEDYVFFSVEIFINVIVFGFNLK